MGYTTQRTKLLLGLGVSSISDVGVAFAQNKKVLQEYYNRVLAGYLPVARGYLLNDEDLSFRQYILDISCQGEVKFDANPIDTILQAMYTSTFHWTPALLGPNPLYVSSLQCHHYNCPHYSVTTTSVPITVSQQQVPQLQVSPLQ